MPEIQLQERREEPDLNKILELLLALDKKITDHITEEKSYKPDLLSLLQLFKDAKGTVRFVKIAAAIGAAAAASYAFFSAHITWKA